MIRAAARQRALSERMRGLITAYWISQLINVVAKLGIADVLEKSGPLSAQQIARRVRAHAPHVCRVLRALASVEVFSEDSSGRFRQTKLSRLLRDVPGSQRNFAMLMMADYNWRAFGGLTDCVVHGGVAFESVHGVPNFEFYERNPQQQRLFAKTQASISAMQNSAIVKAYPFDGIGSLVDVGGSHGHLLSAILEHNRALRGTLFDLPTVVAGADRSGFVSTARIRDRCDAVGGDFFKAVPHGKDAYLMKFILHDWDDTRCIGILRNCRSAMTKRGRVLIIEQVVERGNRPHFSKLIDIAMMTLTGGRERTRAEFASLLARAGLRLRKVIPTGTGLHILEAGRAGSPEPTFTKASAIHRERTKPPSSIGAR